MQRNSVFWSSEKGYVTNATNNSGENKVFVQKDTWGKLLIYGKRIFFAYLLRGAPLLEYGQAESPVQHPGGGEDHHGARVVDVGALLHV